HQLCRITEHQRKKLELAGRGDIKRFFDHIEEYRRQIHRPNTGADELRTILQDLKRSQMAYRRGIFGDGSLFTKTLKPALTPEQRAKYVGEGDDPRPFLYLPRVRWTVSILQRDLWLNDEQRFQLLTVLLEETHPPRQFTPYDYYVVMYQASQLPESKL